MFIDDFNKVDLARSGDHIWYEGVWFHHRHSPLRNIFADHSLLSLEWRPDQPSADTSISTFSPASRGSSHAWQHGYFEARMKWDVVPGAWPAFWLLPVEAARDRSVKETGEIDIFEGQGDHPHTFYGTVHDWINLRSTANQDNRFQLPDNVDLSQFHVYGLLWTPGEVSWYFDNHLLHSEKTPAVLDREHCFLVLGMQEGVNWKLGDSSGLTRSKFALHVDWVRVWQK